MRRVMEEWEGEWLSKLEKKEQDDRQKEQDDRQKEQDDRQKE
jgi:hypothetical protein